MEKMKDEIKITADLLKLKKLLRDLQQLSYSAKKLEERYPEIEFSTPQEMIDYIKVGIAFKEGIEELLEKMKYFDKYAKN